jgi:hypothetical protein
MIEQKCRTVKCQNQVVVDLTKAFDGDFYCEKCRWWREQLEHDARSEAMEAKRDNDFDDFVDE